MSEQKIHFDLLRNAVDSVERAIDLLAYAQEIPNEAKRLKQAVLSVAHGVELLLKERLRRVHPVLIWENVDKFPSLSARTISSELAMTRLANIGGLTFPREDVELIRSLRDTRNAIEHYAWSTTKSEVDQIVGMALSFAVDFAKRQLNYEFLGYAERKDTTVDSLIESHPDFAKAYRARYAKNAKAAGEANVECSYCHTLAVPIGGQACNVCGHWVFSPYLDDDIPF